jgi:hypothetical protein
MSDETTKYKSNDLQSFHVDLAAPENAWKSLQKECPFLSDWGVETLRDGLDGYVQSIVLEPYYMCKDHRNLYSNFYSKRFLETSPNCQRLHFFKDANVQPKDLLANAGKFQDGYLGFSVIRHVRRKCLGRTIIDPCKIGKSIKDKHYLLRTLFKAQINGAIFEVRGYPFMSQDADATLCAHSALWGVCRYLSERYPVYRELYPFDFIRMTESSKGRAVPYRGMSSFDYCKILTEFGAFPVQRTLQKKGATAGSLVLDPDAFLDLYSYVESGFPVLASLHLPRGPGHVVSLIGHTIDQDKPPGVTTGIVDSSHFLKQFVAVDDNFFPYQLLGYEEDLENYGAAYEKNGEKVGIGHAITMTCPLPEKVFVPAELARKKAMRLCKMCMSILIQTGAQPFVSRLFVTNAAAFKRRKLAQAKAGPDRAAGLVTNIHLPHFVWIMELSPLELYKKEICTAEIVMDATAGPEDEGVIYIRIGRQVFFAREKSTVWSRIEGALEQFPQYTHNLGEKDAS